MYTRFASSQTVELAVADQPVPIQHYLRQPQRVVNALAASSQIEQIGEEEFRLKMRPLNFMALSVQPTVDMRIWAAEGGAIHLESIGCEIRGVEYINQRFHLNLQGTLAPCQMNSTTYLKGRADLKVSVELPPAFLFTPKPLLEAAGNGLLASVLMTIKQRLMHQLLSDYRRWAKGQEDGLATALPLQSLSTQ